MTAGTQHGQNQPHWRARLQHQQQRYASWWQTRPQRERRIAVLGLLTLIVLLLWLTAIQPALTTLSQAQQRLPALRLDAARIGAIALQAQQLRARAPQTTSSAVAPDRARLQTSLQRATLAPQVTLAPDDPNLPAHWSLHIDQAPVGLLLDWVFSGVPALGLQVQRLDLQRSIVQGRERPGHVSGVIELREAATP